MVARVLSEQLSIRWSRARMTVSFESPVKVIMPETVTFFSVISGLTLLVIVCFEFMRTDISRFALTCLYRNFRVQPTNAFQKEQPGRESRVPCRA